MDTPTHITVLLNEAVDALAIQADGVYVDGTFGRGGHSRLILSQLGKKGQLWVFDKDPRAIQTAQELAKNDARVHVVHDSFKTMSAHLSAQSVDGILLDLGVSSPQIDEAKRGFSFRQDGPLDMRMDNTRGLTAAQWLSSVDEAELARVIRDYGEERFAKPIAKAIVARRAQQPFTTTLDLANVVAGQVRKFEKGQHPATRTFQAIRIAVNDELGDLDAALTAMLALLKPKGRMAVISFHSLEDRPVKRFIAHHSRHSQDWARLPLTDAQLPSLPLRDLGKQKPGEQEILSNPRARSAILRVAEKAETMNR